MTIRVEIASQDRMVYEGQADIVTLPGIEGEMGILPLHAPLITTLSYGIITVSFEGKEDVFTVAGGVAEVQPDIVTVLADAAENVEEIDVGRAEAARQRAEELLKHAPPTDRDASLALEAAIRRSNLRIGAVQRFRHGRVKPPTDFSGDETH
jgi:F-type H+-transporting ATPase subunit epsilon